MFGYVLPLRGELKVSQWEAYRSLYCGLCHAMAGRCGPFARFFLSYDLTFLAMALTQDPQFPPTCVRRCAVCPLRGRRVCTGPEDVLDAAAEESIILAYWKLRDTVQDENFLRGLPARLGCGVLRRGYRRASQARPAFDTAVRTCLDRLHVLEKENCPSIDRSADAFACLLRAAAGEGNDPRSRALRELFYHVGRWIYLVDAWDDREKDRRRGSYNPTLLRVPEETAEEVAQLRTTLAHSLRLATSALELLDRTVWSPTLENILTLGLPAVEEEVFRGTWRKRRRTWKTNETITSTGGDV